LKVLTDYGVLVEQYVDATHEVVEFFLQLVVLLVGQRKAVHLVGQELTAEAQESSCLDAVELFFVKLVHNLFERRIEALDAGRLEGSSLQLLVNFRLVYVPAEVVH